VQDDRPGIIAGSQTALKRSFNRKVHRTQIRERMGGLSDQGL